MIYNYLVNYRLFNLLILLTVIFVNHSAFAQSIGSIDPSKGKSGTIFELIIRGQDTNFNLSSQVEIIPGKDVKVERTIIKSRTEIIVTINVTPDAGYGTHSIIVTSQTDDNKSEVVDAINAFTVIPSTLDYKIVQRDTDIKHRLMPEEPVKIKSPVQVSIETKISPDNGKMEERLIDKYIYTEDPYYVYDLGTFNGGDKIEINMMDKDDGKILAGPREMLVRPGPVSIRSGIIIIPEANLIRTEVSIFSRFSRFERKKTYGPLEIDYVVGIGYGFGISVEDDPRVYSIGVNYEFFDIVDFAGGLAGWTDLDSSDFKKEFFVGVTFDLRLFKKILDTVTSGLTLK